MSRGHPTTLTLTHQSDQSKKLISSLQSLDLKWHFKELKIRNRGWKEFVKSPVYFFGRPICVGLPLVESRSRDYRRTSGVVGSNDLGTPVDVLTFRRTGWGENGGRLGTGNLDTVHPENWVLDLPSRPNTWESIKGGGPGTSVVPGRRGRRVGRQGPSTPVLVRPSLPTRPQGLDSESSDPDKSGSWVPLFGPLTLFSFCHTDRVDQLYKTPASGLMV